VLSTPSGPIAAAQAAAATAWGADATWLLVNGTTGGIHAAVLATCGPGTALILPRNAHLSAFNAALLAGCTPVWVQPCYDPALGLAHQLTPASLRAGFDAAAAAGLRVGAALVVSPTYFGVLSDVAGVWRGQGCRLSACVCAKRGEQLLLDACCCRLPHPCPHLHLSLLPDNQAWQRCATTTACR
jgi:arginine/lysine/ornithine decarboxylase